jgi:hypothetical protein
MSEDLEKIIGKVYRGWKAEQPEADRLHPDEETFVSFLENRLSAEDNERMKRHLIACDRCAEILSLQLRSKGLEEKEIPEQLLKSTKKRVSEMLTVYILEIILKVKQKTLEIINTTGDVLVGQELVPAAVLRSRQIKDFKDEVNVLKEFKDILVEVKIESKTAETFNLTLILKTKETQNIIKDMRVTLLKDDLELESYLSDSGKVTFEHVLLGKYTLELSTIKDKLATVILDIKI